MVDLEQRCDTKHLGQVGAKAGEHQVAEEDIPLDLLGEMFDVSWVGQAELSSALREGVDCISNCGRDRVAENERTDGVEYGGHGGLKVCEKKSRPWPS